MFSQRKKQNFRPSQPRAAAPPRRDSTVRNLRTPQQILKHKKGTERRKFTNLGSDKKKRIQKRTSK